MIGLNRWHLSEYESAAMWQLYAPRDSAGLAIQSTFDRLSRCFHVYDKHAWIGTLKYIDYSTTAINDVSDVKQWFLHKRREFSYEKELRAMIITASPDGQEVPCDLSILIESIRVAPTAPPYMRDLISETCRLFGVDVDILPSMLT
jgi:hypothetical protein